MVYASELDELPHTEQDRHGAEKADVFERDDSSAEGREQAAADERKDPEILSNHHLPGSIGRIGKEHHQQEHVIHVGRHEQDETDPDDHSLAPSSNAFTKALRPC